MKSSSLFLYLYIQIVMKKIWYFSILLHILAAIFSIGRYHADEQYQIIEFAAYKTGVNTAQELPWEFHEKIRSTSQVAITYAMIKCFNFIGLINPFTQAILFRLFASLLGLFATFLLLKKFRNLDSKLYHALGYLSLLWAFVPWFHARYSSENICASLIIISLFLFDINKNNIKNIFVPNKLWKVFVIALIMGLLVFVSFKVYFFIVGFFIWLVLFYKASFKQIALFILGIIFANALGILVDKWFYGTWEITGWNYFYQNIILHKAENFGREPLWYFFEQTLLQGIPPFSIIIIIAFIYFFIKNPKSTYTWLLGIFILAHFASAHKEERFLFPLIPFVSLIIILAYKDFAEKNQFSKVVSIIKGSWGKAFKTIFIVINTILLFYLCLKPADDYTSTLKYLYNNHKENTIMICEDEAINPYSNLISLNFYRRKNINIIIGNEKIDSLKLQYPESEFIYVTDKSKLSEIKNYKLTKEYSSLPEWLRNFNFNNWVDRIHVVNIYRID